MSLPVFNPALLAGKLLTLAPLLDGLVQDQLISVDHAEQARKRGQWGGQRELHPLIVIANQKIPNLQPPHSVLSLDALCQWLALRTQLPYVRLDPLAIDTAAVSGLVSYAYAARYRLLPIAVDPHTVTFATAEPFITEWMPDLGKLLRRDIKRVLANPLDIQRFLMEFSGLARSLQTAKSEGSSGVDIHNLEQLWELGESSELGAEDKPIIQICDWLLQYAFEQRTSDIHLEPRREKGQVRFRIDGVMHRVYEMPPIVMRAVVSRFKILGRLDVAEKRRPQDGRIKTRSPSGREVELRLATMPTAFGEKCVARIFDPDVAVKNFAQLGFSPEEERHWRALIDHPHGIVLVTGPTGSGKTTTLYSTLRLLADPKVNVCTVEDPIELVDPNLNQMQIQTSIGLTFAQGIRALMRQDPDIIMVGEIRDLETAQMAIQAALTGHLVLSTLHTNDAPSAVTRLLDLGVPHYLIQATVLGVMAQRLIRTLCPHCKTSAPVDPALWETLVAPYNEPPPASVCQPTGCPECRQTGFLGRIAIYEILEFNPALRRHVKRDADTDELRQAAVREGLRPLRLSAAQQVAAGLTTIEEVLKTLPPSEF